MINLPGCVYVPRTTKGLLRDSISCYFRVASKPAQKKHINSQFLKTSELYRKGNGEEREKYPPRRKQNPSLSLPADGGEISAMPTTTQLKNVHQSIKRRCAKANVHPFDLHRFFFLRDGDLTFLIRAIMNSEYLYFPHHRQTF